MRGRSSVELLTVAIAGVIGYAAVAHAVSRQRTTARDRRLRNEIQDTRSPSGEAVAEAVGPLGKEWLHMPAAAALGGFLFYRGAGPRAALPLLASLGAETLSRVLDHTKPHRHPPPGHPDPNKPSFPSGHANETTAVALTSAYVLARENLITPTVAFPIAGLAALASPASRLYLDRHWISDVTGGLCLGLSMAAVCAAIYETTAPADNACAV